MGWCGLVWSSLVLVGFVMFGLVFLFNDISTCVSYLISKPSLYNDSSGTVQYIAVGYEDSNLSQGF